jgi:hypothetical protein
MKTPSVLRAGLVAVALAATGTAFAQKQSLPTVMTDVNPLPAEERDSVGAVVLENSKVRAQRQAFSARQTSLDVSSVGRGTARKMRADRVKEDRQQQREDDANRLHEMGAGALTPP